MRTKTLLCPLGAFGLACIIAVSVRGAQPQPLFPKANVTKEDVEQAIRFECDLRKRYDVLPSEHESWFAVLKGKSKVIVSAPHATAQTRESQWKPADAGTGALAVMLNKLGCATVIYTTCRSPSDPNFYDDNDYKRELRTLIEKSHPRLLIDLHASHWYRPYDVDFGTLGGKSLDPHKTWLRKFSEILRTSGLQNFSQDYFAAAKNETVTRFANKLGVPAVQLEINETWFDFFADTTNGDSEVAHMTDTSNDCVRINEDGAHRFAQLLEGLLRIIDWIDSSR